MKKLLIGVTITVSTLLFATTPTFAVVGTGLNNASFNAGYDYTNPESASIQIHSDPNNGSGDSSYSVLTDDSSGYQTTCEGDTFIAGGNGYTVQGDGKHIGITNVHEFAKDHPVLYQKLLNAPIIHNYLGGKDFHVYRDDSSDCNVQEFTLEDDLIPKNYKHKVVELQRWNVEGNPVWGGWDLTGSNLNNQYCPGGQPILNPLDSSSGFTFILSTEKQNAEINFGCAGQYQIFDLVNGKWVPNANTPLANGIIDVTPSYVNPKLNQQNNDSQKPKSQLIITQ